MPRPRGRSIKPDELGTRYLSYVARRVRLKDPQPTMSGFAEFAEVKKSKTTMRALFDAFGFGRFPPVPHGGYLFLLAFEPPHEILWSSDSGVDLLGRADVDLRARIGKKWRAWIVDDNGSHRRAAHIVLRKGVDVDEFLALKVVPATELPPSDRPRRLPVMPPDRIVPISMLELRPIIRRSPYSIDTYSQDGELLRSEFRFTPMAREYRLGAEDQAS